MSEPSTTENTGVPAVPTGQRRQVTVLFADMVGYMPLAEKLGEENTYLFMQRVHRELSEAIHAQEGTVQEITGDGIMALFGAPVALENAPLRACQAALDIQARMAGVGEEIEAEHGARPAFRVGLHSGPLIIGSVGDDQKMELTALGDTVNFASRLESMAENGTVAMSEATHALVADYVDCEYKGEQEIKGRSEAQKLWQLVAVKQGVRRFDVSRARGLTPLVGRQAELENLERLWAEAKEGQVRLVNIGGDAGIGKSRLVHEFRSRLGEDAFILRGFCSADGQAHPLLPFADVVRRSFGFTLNADLDEARRRLQRGLEVLGLNAETHLPHLLDLLGYDSQDGARANVADEARGIHTRNAVVAMLNERSRLTPTVIFFEDLHWMDKGSEALIAKSFGSGALVPLLIITTHRPEYHPPWSGSLGSTDIALKQLSKSATADLLKARLKVTELPAELTQLVNEKSDGNPLFVEEIINYLLEKGSLQGRDDGLQFSVDAEQSILPTGLESILMDRFDRLQAGPRRALEAAAVMGQRFDPNLLADMTGMADELGEHLSALEAQELVLRETAQATYRFKHALVQDAVYNGMLSSQRRKLHADAGRAIEAAKGSEAADTLAHHYSLSDETAKAIRYLALAGENSLRIYSLDEAGERLDAALVLAETHPEAVDDSSLTDILLHIARIKYFQSEFFAIIDLVEKYLPRVEALGDQKRLSRFLFEGGYANVFACRIEAGRKLLAGARAIGEEIGDELAIAYADLGTMWDRMLWCQPGEARDAAQLEAGERIMAVGRQQGDMWLASKGGLALTLDYASLGQPGKARETITQLMTMSRQGNDPRPRTMALWAMAAVEVFSGNYQEAIENAEEAIRACLSPVDINAAKAYRGMALLLSGQGAAVPELPDELLDVETKGLFMPNAPIKMAMGVGVVISGDMANGFKAIEAAAREAEGWGQIGARTHGDYFTGETYLQMALSKEKPPLAVVLRNLPFLLRTLPFVKAKARSHLQSALDQYRDFGATAAIANCLFSLANLDLAEKRLDDAKTKFQEARSLAQSVEATKTARDSDAALAELAAG